MAALNDEESFNNTRSFRYVFICSFLTPEFVGSLPGIKG